MRIKWRGKHPGVKKKRKYQKTRTLQAPKWGSEHIWVPLLEQDYSSLFNRACLKYLYYFDTVIHGLEAIRVGGFLE